MFQQSAALKLPFLACDSCGQAITDLQNGQVVTREDGQYEFLHWECLCQKVKSSHLPHAEWQPIEDWLAELLIVLRFNQTSWLLMEYDQYRKGLK
jgi:hypothetical protein